MSKKSRSTFMRCLLQKVWKFYQVLSTIPKKKKKKSGKVLLRKKLHLLQMPGISIKINYKGKAMGD